MRVLPDVPAIDKAFDYLVPDELGDQIRVGTMVRVELHGRRVAGWVVADEADPPPAIVLRPIAKVTGWGPAPELIGLARWAAHRWAGRTASLLRTASPTGAVRGLPPAPPPRPATAPVTVDLLVGEAFGGGPAVVRLGPAADPHPYVEEAARRGPALVLVPSLAAASHTAIRLRRAGMDVALLPREWARAAAGGSSVVGTRAAAWAPVPGLAAVVVVDAHDEVYQEERAPTWNAWQVAAERARRAGVPCVLLSPCPTLHVLAAGRLLVPTRNDERRAWAAIDVVDRRADDPRSGLYGERVVDLVRSGRRVVCVLNVKGRARLLACAACGVLARCERCGGAAEQDPAPGARSGGLVCRQCQHPRPTVCMACGAQRMKALRVGVGRVGEELTALAGEPVGTVTAETQELPTSRVVVGTEAALHRLGAADVVVFLDFDQELLAPRYRAAEQALSLLARAARLVGGKGAGRVVVQTRIPDHEVLQAALHADPGLVAAAERERRSLLRLPPHAALALVSGEPAAGYVAALPPAVEVQGPVDGRFLVRADGERVLADALAAVPRPSGRMRIEVDPLRA